MRWIAPATRFFQDSLPEQDVCVFRQPHPILRNTLSNWVLANQPDESLLPNDAIDLNQLPPLHFSAIDEDLPSSLS